jgi:hypothetical protein
VTCGLEGLVGIKQVGFIKRGKQWAVSVSVRWEGEVR